MREKPRGADPTLWPRPTPARPPPSLPSPSSSSRAPWAAHTGWQRPQEACRPGKGEHPRTRGEPRLPAGGLRRPGEGAPRGRPPTRSSRSRPAGWPAAEAPTLGVLAEDAAALSGLKARLRSPPNPEDYREPRPPTPKPSLSLSPLGRRFTTSPKTPLSVCKAPGLPGNAHPFTPAPPRVLL